MPRYVFAKRMIPCFYSSQAKKGETTFGSNLKIIHHGAKMASVSEGVGKDLSKEPYPNLVRQRLDFMQTALAVVPHVAGRGRAQILVKPKKVGGSTMAGIIRRIGEKRGYWGYSNMLPIVWEPGVWANHAHLRTFWRHMWLLRRPSILIAWGRQPADRCLSSYYHFKVPSCPWHKRAHTLSDGVRDVRTRSLGGERTGRRR